MPKTKIIGTIGPASESAKMIELLIRNNLNIARLNFSHGTHAEHLDKMQLIRKTAERLKKPVAILQDLCGPKIRIGLIREPGVELKPGQEFTLTSEEVLGDENRVSVSYKPLPKEVKPKDRILLADGLLELQVRHAKGKEIYCKVVTGGHLSSRKGLNLTTGTIKANALTPKDREDLLFGLKNCVDYVALSFVKTAEDILRVKRLISKHQIKETPVIAKIEKHEALGNIDEILEVSDAIMVARGDLGVEIPLEQVPGIQKMLVRKANVLGKPVIIATQMLRSMVNSPRPTRAEAADVANGILDGADAIMLSEETASGEHPVEAVRYMASIAENAEEQIAHDEYLQLANKSDISASVAHAACVLADQLNASAIIATTRSGSTAMNIARFRPRQKILALSPDDRTVKRLALCWGCIPSLVEEIRDTDEMIENTTNAAVKTGIVAKHDIVVITAGHPVLVRGTTNMLRVKQI